MPGSQTQIFDGTSSAVFKKQSALGRYSKVTFFRPEKGSLHVIYDSEAPWLAGMMKELFGTVPESLTLEQIYWALRRIKRSLTLQSWAQQLGLTKKKYLGGVREHFYFDEPSGLLREPEILMALVAKCLFEKYTRIETRIVTLQCLKNLRTSWTLVIKIQGQRPVNLIFDSSFRLKKYHLEHFENGLLLRKFKFIEDRVMVTVPQGEWTTQKKSLSIFSQAGNEINFQITGRTPAEKRFEKDEETIKTAEASQLVPMELNFHPFWRPLGHTTLRIGRSLYELSATGWKAHNQGANTARAFIFNNPFFRKQLGLFADQGMPPMSLGVTLLVPKHKIDVLQVILENLAAAQGSQKEKFSLLKNNCNQGIVRVLTQAGIEGFDYSGYLEFSTVLTYRNLLLNAQHPVEGVRIYPLPNTILEENTVRSWIPHLLYRNNNVSRELRRALPVFPRDILFIRWKQLVAYVQGLVGDRHVEL
ncbi:MAG: hypothetical protein J7501_08635 [Bdellovibrio sp.]|nr:hypothetical protein [Bdellovibrio sp.]